MKKINNSLILNKKIILASTSYYRSELLGRLQLPFTVIAPETDETAIPGESCREIALRLANAKALAGAQKSGFPDGLVIGSDQVADLNGTALGKPGTRARAHEQLVRMRGEIVIFHTALALLDIKSGRIQSLVIPTTVKMRVYTDAQIAYYLDQEDALDCAGSAKSEGLGAALIASMTSDDPTALIGLPLIALTTLLGNEGVEVLCG